MAVWGKLYGSLYGSPKWRRVSKGARALWCTALSWCIDQEASEGRVPADMLKSLDGTRAEADCLVRYGLWETDGDDWRFHDWDDHQVSRERMSARRKSGAERQKRFRDGVSNGATDASVTAYRRDETREDEKTPVGVSPDAAAASSRRKPERALPDDWAPTAKHEEQARALGVDVQREAYRFRNHAQANDRRARDWDAAFRNWLDHARPAAPAAAASARRGNGGADYLDRW